MVKAGWECVCLEASNKEQVAVGGKISITRSEEASRAGNYEGILG
jgi:hypothetical protein